MIVTFGVVDLFFSAAWQVGLVGVCYDWNCAHYNKKKKEKKKNFTQI